MKSAEAFVLCSVKLHTDCSGFCLFVFYVCGPVDSSLPQHVILICFCAGTKKKKADLYPSFLQPLQQQYRNDSMSA